MSARWRRILSLTFLCFGPCRAVYDRPVSEKIISGKETRIEVFPWLVSLQSDNDVSINHFCGGSIYSQDFVITAAHCIKRELDVNQPYFQVRAGSTKYNEGGFVHRVVKIIKHPRYNRTRFQNDIALVKVSPPFEFSERVQTISLNSGLKLPVDSEVDVIGWGRVQSNVFTKPVTLQHVTMLVTEQLVCEKYVREAANKQVCARSGRGSQGICMGDSGGSLTYNDVLYGVTSWLMQCGHENYPSGFTSVSAHAQWIRQVTVDCTCDLSNSTSPDVTRPVRAAELVPLYVVFMFVALCVLWAINVFAVIYVAAKTCCVTKTVEKP